MPILDNLLSALGLERKARPAARPAVPGSSGPAGALPLSGWSAGLGHGTSGGFGSTSPIPSPFADAVPWHLNPVVAAGIAWFARNFPVPDLHVVRDGGADDGAEVDGHWLPRLFDKPNELWSFFDFFAASVMSDITDGNTFWLKRKDGRGQVVDLWWLEPWGVQIVPDPTRAKALLGYRYDSGDVHASYRPDEVLHIRAAQPDRADPRRGQSPLSPVDRSIRVTTELGRYDEAILKNGGASPGVFAPTKLDGPPIPQEDIGRLQSWYKQNATGPNAGSPIFAPFGLQFLKTGFSPEELSLDKLPRRHVSFILAAIGLSPMVLGYEDESKTYANFAEACRSAYENALMPMQARFAEAINHDEDFISEGERLRWDYAHVTYLQDDRAAKIHSLVEAVGGGILDANEARAELHYEPKEEEPEPPAQPPPAPGADGTDGATDGAAGIAALLAARGGNGKVPAGANGNGKPARPAAKALPGLDLAPTDADLARRTAAVLDALEAKLLGGGRSVKATGGGNCGIGPGGFKPGNTCARGGGSSGGGGAPVGQRVYQAEADAARRRLADLDESAGGRHVLEFGPPETARDRKALEKADAAGKPVVVRATLAPEHRVVEEGGATHHEVGGDRLYSVLPDNSEGAGGWTVRRHYFDREGSHEDFPHRTRVRAEQHASAEAGKVARSRTETDYLVGHSLSKLKFHKYTAAPGYRTTFRVLVPEGEPSAKGVAGTGAEAGEVAPDDRPFDPAAAVASVKALYRAGRLTRDAARRTIREVKRRACRDHRGRFASCGTGGGATSEDLYHLPARGQGRRSGGGGPGATAADGKAAVKAAQAEQRAANAKAAAEKPVIEEPRPENLTAKYFKGEIKQAEKDREADQALEKRLAPRLDELEARRKIITEKAFGYSLSARTRKKYEKELDEQNKEYMDVKYGLLGARTRLYGDPNSGMKPVHEERIESLRQKLTRAEAEHAAKGPIRIEYARDQANHPDLIPPGPIQDRLAAYKIGDAKVAAIDGVGKKYDAEAARLLNERTRLRDEINDGILDQISAIADAEDMGRPAHHPEVQARVDAIQAKVDRASGDIHASRLQQHELEAKRRAEVTEILAVDDPVEFQVRDIRPGFKTSDGPLSPPTAGTRKATDEATAWLGRVTAKGDDRALEIEVGEGPGYRAHHGGSYIQAEINESAPTMVHEFGHAIDYQIRVGERKVGERSVEFLNHRVGDETSIDMRERFGNGDPGEMGRKDKFDQVWSGRQEYKAYYAGKEYVSRTSSEILSMGAEELFKDPIGFARKDPEYAKLAMGLLDGSLR